MTSVPVTPITSLDDPRAITILSTEHWSLLASRSLAYNEAFIRGGMFLTFLSMSFVALALLAQGMSFGTQFLTIAAVVLGFDLVIGLATVGRINGANVDDLRAAHGMARIRHAYTQIAPITERYFTTPTHDDIASVLLTYGAPPSTGFAFLVYGLTTSGGMIGLIVVHGGWRARGGARTDHRRLGRAGGLDRPGGGVLVLRRPDRHDVRVGSRVTRRPWRPVPGAGGVVTTR